MLVDRHDTAFSWLKAKPMGLGVGWIDQALPFQASASVVLPEPFELLPTAVQALVVGQETPDRLVSVAPVGLGLGRMAQEAPFQDSVSEAWSDEPTAMHELDDLHETPKISESDAPDGVNGLATDQALPFQISASGTVLTPSK
jgi:hypothetical protein